MAVIGFARKFPKEVDFQQTDTNFVERILRGLIDHDVFPREKAMEKIAERTEICNTRVLETCPGKIHTIRKKGSKARKKGDLIHPSINVRSENQYQFAPEFKIVKLEDIQFSWSPEVNGRTILTLKIGKKEFRAADMISGMTVWVSPVLIELARNDGFSDTKKFLKWFAKGGKFQLIYWVDHTYEIPEE